MMCEECGKNAASIKLVSVIGGEKHEKLICPECMAKVQKQFRALDLSGLAGILGGLMSKVTSSKENAEQNAPAIEEDASDAETDALVCLSCGKSFLDYKKTGYLGCPQCYQAFREPLAQTLKRLHGYTRHIGRVPGTDMGSVSIRLDIDRLRHQLSRAITEEEYEQAADIRDRIKELKGKLSEIAVREGSVNE